MIRSYNISAKHLLIFQLFKSEYEKDSIKSTRKKEQRRLAYLQQGPQIPRQRAMSDLLAGWKSKKIGEGYSRKSTKILHEYTLSPQPATAPTQALIFHRDSV